jgi:hypothetical protein
MASKDHNKVFNTVTMGILITIFSGLVLFMFSFFNTTFPKAQARLDVLENEVHTNEKRLSKLFDKIDKIYEILIQRHEKD